MKLSDLSAERAWSRAVSAISEALKQGRDIPICFDCANAEGGVWPKHHVATIGPGHCPNCKRDEIPTCALSDWDWPGRETKLDREI
jgi:hypothetical protein